MLLVGWYFFVCLIGWFFVLLLLPNYFIPMENKLVLLLEGGRAVTATRLLSLRMFLRSRTKFTL